MNTHIHGLFFFLKKLFLKHRKCNSGTGARGNEGLFNG